MVDKLVGPEFPKQFQPFYEGTSSAYYRILESVLTENPGLITRWATIQILNVYHLSMVFISGVSCHILTTIGVQRAGAERCSFAGAFEIATSLAIGWIIFSESFSITQGLGIFFICLVLILTGQLNDGIQIKGKSNHLSSAYSHNSPAVGL